MKTLCNSVPGLICFLFISFFLAMNSSGQVKITFIVDTKELIDSGYFKEGDKLIIRGSFNQWAGYDDELIEKYEESFLLGNDFNIDCKAGDMIEYKFVIITPEGIEYWEQNPNPENPPHGNRLLVCDDSGNTLPVADFNYGDDIKGRRLSRLEILQADFMQARTILEQNHPALYDYTSKEILDSLFNHYYNLISQETEYNIFYQYISAILAEIGCGHTKLFIPDAYWTSKPDHFFPLQLQINPDEVIVKGSYGQTEKIPRGSLVLSINGKPITDILQELMILESSDGFIPAFKINSIQKRFPEKYAMLYGFPDTFRIAFIAPEKSIPLDSLIPSATRQQVQSVPMRGQELSMNQFREHDAAMITINTFGYYAEVPKFKAFIDSCFMVLRSQNIGNLIIDLRGNDGGDPFCASYLFSYLEKTPVPYFEEHYGHYDTLAHPVPMPENHYTGNTFVIIDGGGFSTTGHLCGLLKYHGLVTFVGTDLGSTYTCTGNVMYPGLDHTHLILGTARERRYSAAVEGLDPKAGIAPDHVVRTGREDIINGDDAQLNFILSLLK